MEKYFLGVDIGSISTKGVIINEKNDIIASEYLETSASPIDATKKVIESLKKQIDDLGINVELYGIGTTGSARNLIGSILGANVIKNEITAHAVGTMSRYKDVSTILEIGGQDSKIIFIKNGVVVDYAMNTLCAAGTGAFLSSQAKRLGVDVKDIGKIALMSKNPAKIAARCTVFAESDLVHRAQVGAKKEDIIAGICEAVAKNYLNNLCKNKKIEDRVVFQGGVSKNIGVVKAFEKLLHKKVYVDKDSHLFGALGIAIISKNSATEKLPFDFDIKDKKFDIKSSDCTGCANNCELVSIYSDGKLIDTIGSRCQNTKRTAV